MQQGLLFEPEVMARTELQDAIARAGFSQRDATAGRISTRLAGSQTHVGAGIGVCGIQDGGETVGSGFRLRSLAKTGSAAEHARCFQILDSIAKAQLLFAASGLESEVV